MSSSCTSRGGGLLLDLGHARAAPRRRDAAQLGHERQVAPDGHLVVERRRVGQKADARADLVRVARDVDAVDGHLAGGRQEHAAEDLERGRLAGAVEAEEADDLAALDGEGEVADGGVLAVVLGQSFDFDHGGGGDGGSRAYADRRRIMHEVVASVKSWNGFSYSRPRVC